ncbi:MAG: hypothetical protein ACM31C_27455 [Acidobacteriota bacterium]
MQCRSAGGGGDDVLRLAIAACLVAACHSSKAAQQLDAEVDALPPPGPNAVMLSVATSAPPDLIMYRDGTGPWLVPELGSSSYVLHVTNDYEWLVVCAGPSGFDAEIEGKTFADGAHQVADCYRSPVGPNTVDITGQMVQSGTVWMQNRAQSSTADWNFTLPVNPGTHNLVAYDSDHMLIMRSINVTGPMALPTVDVVLNGTAMTPVTLTLNNIGSDVVTSELSLIFAGEDAAEFSGTSTTLMTPPQSLLANGETEFLMLTATGATSQLQAANFFDGTQTTFSMMAPLTNVDYSETNGTIAATWANLPTFESLRLRVSAGSAGTLYQAISVTKSWVAATGATSLSFGPLPSSYNPAWTIDPAGPYVRDLQAITFDATSGTVYYSGVPQGVNGATPRLAGVHTSISVAAARGHRAPCARSS